MLGLTFKENCADLRNSKVIDIIRELQSYGIDVTVTDAWADPEEALREYGVKLTPRDELPRAYALVAAVAHKEYQEWPLDRLAVKLIPGGVFVDVKAAFDAQALTAAGFRVWRL